MTSRDDLTAAQWRQIEAISPGKAGDRGRTAADHRTFVNGVMWGLRSGARWQHLPARYGHWKSGPKRLTRWAKAGVWERLLAMLREAPKNQEVRLDATIVRAHQPAATGRGGTRTRLWGVPEAD
jgi:transposase